MNVNLFDVLLLLSFAGVTTACFIAGLGRVVTLFVGLYAGAIFAAHFYGASALWVVSLLPSLSVAVANVVLFVGLLVAGAGAVSVGLSRTFFVRRCPAWLGAANNIAGGLAGIVVALVVVLLLAMVAVLGLQALEFTSTLGPNAALLAFHTQIWGSTLTPLILRAAPWLVEAIAPWFPGGIPPIFAMWAR